MASKLGRSSYLTANTGNFEDRIVIGGRPYVKADDLRYGTNPHQPAAYYRPEDLHGAIMDMVTLKNGKDLVIYGTDVHIFDYVYFDKQLVHGAYGEVFTSTAYFSIPLPVMSNKLGYTFTSNSFNNSFTYDKVKAERVSGAKAYKLKEAVFIDDTFEVSNEYNDFNHFKIYCDHDDSYIVFESSKQFRIFAGIGVYSEIGRYRITNDISFADLSIK